MLNIRTENITRVEKAVGEFQTDIFDLRPFFRKLSQDHLVASIAQVFETEGYGTWKPLSPEYARWKAERYPGKTILRRNDAYFNAATHLQHPGSYLDITPKRMEFGISESYFVSHYGYFYPRVHEEGGGRVPKRAVFELLERNEMFQDLVTRAAERWVQDEASHFFEGIGLRIRITSGG